MEAFFLPAAEGVRFCLYHAPQTPPRAGVVFVPAFAEEMNKSRHLVAQASRRLAAMGVGVLLIDLKGCGDSSGLFEEATWDDWRADIQLAVEFMQQRGHQDLTLWGMRLGALLAAQCAAELSQAVARCLLWQPVAQGDTHLTQFLRLRVANAMLSGTKGTESGKELRAQLAAGDSLEIAGYRLSPSMAASMEQLSLEALRPPCPVHWFEVVAEDGRALPPAALRVIAAWREQGTTVAVTPLVAESFWGATNAAELVQCQAIVDATAHEAQAWL